MSSVYNSIDYGTEERATQVCAESYIMPFGTVEESAKTMLPAQVYLESIAEGWEWPTNDPSTCMDAIDKALTENK